MSAQAQVGQVGGAFDPQSFLDSTITDALDTKVLPIPPGEYPATVLEIKARPWVGKSDPTKSGVALDLTWEIDDQSVREAVKRDKVTVRQSIMLDLTPSGGLDTGKGRNLGLGRLRAALGLNVPGQPYSHSMLPGRMAKVKVSNRVVGEDTYSDVDGVVKLG